MTMPSAYLGEYLNGRGQKGLAFVCSCGELLAVYAWSRDGHHYVFLRTGLIRLPKDRDGLPAYGLPQRTLTSGKTQRAEGAALTGRSRRLRSLTREWKAAGKPIREHAPRFKAAVDTDPTRMPIIAYCPRPGVCGKAQRIG